MADTVGEQDIRTQSWERDVKGFALQSYTMMDLVMNISTSAWTNSYYQETAADLTGGTGSAVKGIPRLADFPAGEVGWTLKSSIILKHGMEAVISWEDVLTSNIDVVARTLLRVGRAVSKSVDSVIYNALTENDTPSTINTVAITAGSEWDSATVANRDPIKNILDSIAAISDDNYDIIGSGNGYLVVNPTDYANLLGNTKVMNNPTFKMADVVANGTVGQICGLKLKVSKAVTADKALVVIAKECGTWKEALPLTVEIIKDPMKSYRIRAAQIGTCQLTNPEAVCLITNTRA